MRAVIGFLIVMLWPALAAAQGLGGSSSGDGATSEGDAGGSFGEAPGFTEWVQDFRVRAVSQGIRLSTLDQAMVGLSYRSDVIELDRNQTEFSRTIWDYLSSAVSDARVTNGRAALAANAEVLERIEEQYGVDKEIIVAIWGVETSYGAGRGSIPVIDAVATLAYDGRRAEFFEDQLVAALRILQAGDTDRSNMRGSWAGAMGHTQFIPTSYQAYAVDFDGDGKRNIWGEDPTDALASAANYLARAGWQRGMPWGFEVILPEGFDYAQASRSILREPSAWAELGIRAADGRAFTDFGPASILLPAGAQGSAFMIFDNFAVLEAYNTADAYVIAVGHLADRIAGGGPIQGTWPFGDRALTFDERIEMQERLTAAGFDTLGVDGLVGPKTIDAIRAYQLAEDLVPDGYASLRLLERLRGS